MARIAPFPGWRYDPGKVDVQQVVAPPYDVIDDAEQEALYQRDPHNVIRLILGMEQDTDNEGNNKYTRAASHIASWRQEGVLIHDQPALYLCEQEFEFEGCTHTRTGFFARILLEEFGEGSVYPHERTLSGPKVDRLNLMHACKGNLSPIFGLLSDDDGQLTDALGNLADWEPTVKVTDDNGAVTRFWVVDHEDKTGHVSGICEAAQIFIADGHHRYETALNYRNEVRDAMQAAGQELPPLGELESDWIMMMCVPISDPGLVIGPTHRLVHDAPGFDAEKLLEGCRENFDVTTTTADEIKREIESTDGLPVFGLALNDNIYRLELKDKAIMDERAGDKPEPWRELDVSVLHLLILEDLLGIDEEKLLKKTNIFYVRSADEALEQDKSDSRVQCTFLMRPTTMDQVRAVSHAGEVMPQKSTYFYPKVLSGLVFNLFA